MTKQIKSLIKRLINIGYLKTDSKELKLKKSSLVIVPLIIGPAAFIWGLSYIAFEHYLSASIPLLYSFVSLFNLWYLHKTKDIQVLQNIQLYLVLLLPFFLMWSLGGFALGGFVMIWAFFAPIAALAYQRDKKASYWYFAFIALVLFSTFIDQYLLENHSPVMPQYAKEIFFFLNITFGLSGIYFLIKHFIDEKEKNANILLQKKHEALLGTTEELKKSKKELLNLNNNLNILVDERTKELEQSLINIQETQDQLIESEKMASLGELVAGVAHEINTPVGLNLTASTHLVDITLEIEKLYNDGQMSENDFKQYLQSNLDINKSIHINSKRAAELITSFKRVAVDLTVENNETFKLYNILEHVIISIKNILKRNNVKLIINCDKNLTMKSYPGPISQIFTNLITNSILHGFEEKEAGQITIDALIKDNNFIQIIYKDDGKGIKENILPRIFDPFFTTKRESGGTGLGMHIIYNIISSRLGGKIKASSKVGDGVIFDILLQQNME